MNDYERAERMSAKFRNRNKLKDKEIDKAFDNLSEGISDISRMISFLHDLKKNPSLVFTESRKCIGDSSIERSSAYGVLNAKKNTGYTIHDFQNYLSTVANDYFQEWLKRNEINIDANIETRDPKSFPSIYAIYVKNQEVFQFNIYKQWYGQRVNPVDEEVLRKNYQRNIEEKQKIINEYKRELLIIEKYKSNPIKHIKSFNDLRLTLKNWNNIPKIVNKKIDNMNKLIKLKLQEIEEIQEYLPIQIEKNMKYKKDSELLERFFIELNYRKNEKQHELY